MVLRNLRGEVAIGPQIFSERGINGPAPRGTIAKEMPDEADFPWK
jgi:hypothetical protein